MDLDVDGVLEVDEEEMVVLAPDWYREAEGPYLVVTPTSEHKEPPRDWDVGTSEPSPFPLSLEKWDGMNLMNPQREHLSSVSNETIEALVPDKVLISTKNEQRVYRIPDVD
jgi:hypothetical protein